MENRYQIYIGSASSHCCFCYSIFDTTKPEIIKGEQYKDEAGNLMYYSVCECMQLQDAELIRDSLNKG